MKLGRFPLRVSATRVNWLTTSASPATSRTEIEATVGVLEDPKARDLRCEPLSVLFSVSRRDPEQDDEARPAGGDELAGDAHRRLPHPLDDRAHSVILVAVKDGGI